MAEKRYQLRPFTWDDLEFLYQVYAGTRCEEMARTGWGETQIEEFLRMQFQLQHVQYLDRFKNAAFDIIYVDKTPVGRLYVDRGKKDILVIDIALLPAFRRQGIGAEQPLRQRSRAVGTGRSKQEPARYPGLGREDQAES